MRNAIILVCLLLLGFLVGMPSPALAFEVKKDLLGLGLVEVGKPIHEEITKQVLEKYEVDGVGPFSQKAIDEIVEFNTSTDDVYNQEYSDWHFDNEDFSGGSQRLRQLKERIIARVKAALESGSQKTDVIYSYLGGALHTLQDFYAHSNWVELENQKNPGNEMINKELGRGEISNVADKNTPTCRQDDPATLDGKGLEQLTSGYFQITFGWLGIKPDLSKACTLPIAGKCLHGWERYIPLVAPKTCNGINKDNSDRPGHDTARKLAVEATRDYLDQILKEGDLAGNVDAAKFLMGIPR